MVTIKDIAKNLGLSNSTVSRALNDHPAISSKTKKEVREEAERLNFTFNSIAQGLTNNKSYNVTLLVDIDDEKSIHNSFFYEQIHGIERYVYKKGYSLNIANINTMLNNQKTLDFLVKSKRTDGVIMPSTVISKELINELNKSKIPFVSIGQPVDIEESISWVDVDNYRGAKNATKYFLNKNKKNIAILGIEEDKLFSTKRLEGYIKSFLEQKIEVDHELIIKCSNSKEDGFKATEELFLKNKDIEAIICANDILSFGVIEALKKMGKKIPEDIEIISFDNEQLAQLSYPSLTTIDIDVFELGYQSAKMLFQQMETGHIDNYGLLISTNLLERDTTEEKK